MSESNPWSIQSSEKKFENPWIEVIEYEVSHIQSTAREYGKVHFKNLAIGIVPLDEDLNTWLVGQYRFPIDQYSWEIPAGGGKLDVPPLETAKRELREETGLSAKRWIEINQSYLSNSVTDEKSYSFLALETTVGESDPDDDEILKLRKIPLREVCKMIRSREITDALTILSVWSAKEWLESNGTKI